MADGERIVLERFRILRKLGQGGMGTVHEVEHIHLKSKHAAKALHFAIPLGADDQKQMEERFLREARICASVRHPNLVPVTDFGTTDGIPYIVMDYINGKDLQELIKEQGPFDDSMALRITRDIAGALGALHDEQIIHRDMKPPNIMIEQKTGRVVVTDLGIAKDLASGGAQLTQGIIGTPAYMAPEQVVDSSKATFATDIYSLGGVLYAMLAGKDPFTGDNALVVINQAREALLAFGSLAEVAKSRGLILKPEVSSLLHDMTQREVSKRMSSAKDVVERCTAIIDTVAKGKPPTTMQNLSLVASMPSAPVDGTMLMGLEEVDAGAHQTGTPNTGGAPHAGTAYQAPPSPAGPGTAPTYGMQQPQAAAHPGTFGQAPTSNTKRDSRKLLAALQDDGSAPAPAARSGGGGFAGVLVLLVVLAAAGGGGFYYYQFLLKGQTDATSGNEAPASGTQNVLDAGAKTTPTASASTANVTADAEPSSSSTAVAVAVADRDAFDVAKAPRSFGIAIPGAAPLELVLVEGGAFRIGSNNPKGKDEGPSVQVSITRPFYISKYETTTAQFASFLNAAPQAMRATVDLSSLTEMGLEENAGTYAALIDEQRRPVRAVSHRAARSFCSWVASISGLGAELPSEVQWEYAARGAQSSVYPWGNEWADGRCCAGEEAPADVGSYPDGVSWCGAQDMAGNVFEWCADRWVDKRYTKIARTDPGTPGSGSSDGLRVIRGGCFGNDAHICRSSWRNAISGQTSDAGLGFRIMIRANEAVLTFTAGTKDQK